ncbi:hypothetical protein JMJ35_003522 [Cladonia borealis]|uniref:Uncharacterized protein n=1 Tax=Cladonia borealis TaxID=184061 RepID=A0AA39R4R1_9LECA|nr:hypothetical protein JMJ35_003522 [Cladonia borealis]
MPGRRSSVAAPIKNTAPQKRKAKRSLNALAIAEEQIPVRSKIRQHRLGQSEIEPTKRKRNEEGEHEDRDEDLKQAKRRKSGDKDKFGNELEEGSDSSGNEWVVGQVDEDDDSDLDSDEAMGESDEEKFEGFAFRGSSATISKRKDRSRVLDTQNQDEGLRDIDLREDEHEDKNSSQDEEDDGLGDDAVDLAAMLDASDNVDDLPHESCDSFDLQDPNSQSNSDEDAEGGNSSAEDEESIVSFSGEDEEPGDSAKLASLQNLVSSMNEHAQTSTRMRPSADAQESTTPSDFGLNSTRKLTVADMIPSITDPRLRKSLKLLADNDSKSSTTRGGVPKKLDVPLPKRQQDRLDRTAAYEKSKETLKRWIDTVKHNRRAEHLSFPILDPNAVAAQGSQRLLPTSHSQPLTDLESTIQNILQDSGLAAPHGKSDEDQLQAFEELKTNKMPLEEVQARRAELRRTRELLFREEIRAKRIKKIKSKTYRKVHRKERERIAQQEKDALIAAGVEDSESEQELRDRRRAEERMGARHRESRWAKGVKESGRARWDEDARGGVTEMARRGEELKRRIEGKNVAGDQDVDVASGSESEEDDETENGDDKSGGRLERLYEKANGLDSEAQGSKLASMDFMKRAESARKARNDSDVEAIRRELAGEEMPNEEESTEGRGRQSFGPMKNKPSLAEITPKVHKSDFEEREESDFENEDSYRIPNDDDGDVVVDTSKAHPKAKPGKSSLLRKVEKEVDQIGSDQNMLTNENPWLADNKKASNGSRRRIQETDKGAIISNTVVPAKTASVEMPAKPRSALKGAREAEKAQQGGDKLKPVASASTVDDDQEDDEAERLPFVLRNQDLVRKAFAGDEVVADFAKEKQQITKDDEEKIIDNTLPGWGSWTGAGVSKKQEKRNKGKILVKEPGIAKEKRQDAKLDRVIINEKRVKKNSKYLASNLPHPFETRQQYERSLRLPVGPEWTTKETFQSATKPRILMKQGVIKPMAKPMI